MPPAFTTLGWFLNPKGLDDGEEILETLEKYKEKLDYPVDGIILTLGYLDSFESLSFNPNMIEDVPKFVDKMTDSGRLMINIIKSGFNEKETEGDDYPVIIRGEYPYPSPADS